MEDVKDFFRRFYTPNNATLVVGGDFDPVEARALIEKHFGGLPPGPPVARLSRWVPRLDGEKRVEMQDRVQLPRVTLFWHTVPLFDPDDAPLDVLAYLLARGKSSRLYQALVHTTQMAQEVNAIQDSRGLAGSFQITAMARPGHTTAELEEAILAELARLRDRGPSRREVERILTSIESDFVRDLQRLGGVNSVTDRLNFYNHFAGEPNYFQKDLDRYLAVTPEDVRRVARTYFGPDRVVLTVSPQGRLAASDSPAARDVDRSKMPEHGPMPPLRLPALHRAELPNGLKLLVAEHHELPLVEMNLVVAAGSSADPPDRPGLANLTAQMLDEGTAGRGALDIARDLDELGARLSLYTDADSSGATLTTLRRNAAAALAILADVVTGATFPAGELERVRKQLQTRLLQERDNAVVLSQKATAKVVFGEAHPYGHTEIGSEQTIASASPDELRAFWTARWRPAGATLIVVGDVTPAEARALAEEALGGWDKGQPAPPPAIPAVPPPAERVVYLIDKPGAAQSVIAAAHVGLARNAPDYHAAAVMNTALGGMFMSRLNLNLRENKGYTYGARSQFEWRRAPGAFSAGASVQTRVTKESLVETIKELEDIAGPRPLTATELEFARNNLVRGFVRRFETPGEIAEQLRVLVVNDLPDDWLSSWVAKIEAVTLEDANRAAREHLLPARAAIVVVGDAAQVRAGIEELNLGRLVVLDATGRPAGPGPTAASR